MLRVPSTLVRYSCRGSRAPKPIIGRDVKQRRRNPASARSSDAAVGEIADHDLDRQASQIAAVGAAARQRAHLPAGAQQGPRDRRADEAGRAGDQRLHARRAVGAPATAEQRAAHAATARSERIAAR